jgi:hypothetical protein
MRFQLGWMGFLTAQRGKTEGKSTPNILQLVIELQNRPPTTNMTSLTVRFTCFGGF